MSNQQANPDVTEWITTAEAAELTGYSVKHLRRLIRRGRAKARKPGDKREDKKAEHHEVEPAASSGSSARGCSRYCCMK